jgi:hypothetical protein
VFTGDDDAVVHGWRMANGGLSCFCLQIEEVLPVSSWMEHTLGITGVICGAGTALNARVFTSSLDQTVRQTATFALSPLC